MSPLTYDHMEGLSRLLVSLGVTMTRKASTVSMSDEGKAGMKIIRQTGWISVADKDLTTDVRDMIDAYLEEIK